MISRFLIIVFGMISASPALGGGILPDRINQIIIQGRFSTPSPTFLAIFSSQPLNDERGRLTTILQSEDFAAFENSKDMLGIRLYGKPVTQSGRVDYFFGTLHDAERPWNSGAEFRQETDYNFCIILRTLLQRFRNYY